MFTIKKVTGKVCLTKLLASQRFGFCRFWNRIRKNRSVGRVRLLLGIFVWKSEMCLWGLNNRNRNTIWLRFDRSCRDVEAIKMKHVNHSSIITTHVPLTLEGKACLFGSPCKENHTGKFAFIGRFAVHTQKIESFFVFRNHRDQSIRTVTHRNLYHRYKKSSREWTGLTHSIEKSKNFLYSSKDRNIQQIFIFLTWNRNLLFFCILPNQKFWPTL